MSHLNGHGMANWKQYVILVLDEIHIREDLVYNKHTGALVDFTNPSDITRHLEEFERSLDSINTTDVCPPSGQTHVGDYSEHALHKAVDTVCPVHLPQFNW